MGGVTVSTKVLFEVVDQALCLAGRMVDRLEELDDETIMDDERVILGKALVSLGLLQDHVTGKLTVYDGLVENSSTED